MTNYEQLDLGPRPNDAKPGPVWRALAGPGHAVTLAEAAELAERAFGASDMGVLAVQEFEFGWAIALQGRRYITTRNFDDMLIGHGLTIVDRTTGDVYSGWSGSSDWDTVLGYLGARSSPAAG